MVNEMRIADTIYVCGLKLAFKRNSLTWLPLRLLSYLFLSVYPVKLFCQHDINKSDTLASKPASRQQRSAESSVAIQNRLTWLLAVVLLHTLQALQQVVHVAFDLAQLPLDRLQLVHFDWEGKKKNNLILGWWYNILILTILGKHLHLSLKNKL